MAETFDYVIVGAGSAGAVLANRLSADPRNSVCLIEAGPPDSSPLIHMPLGLIWLSKDKNHNWLYASSPQAALHGRRVSIPRGKVLGGSSSINGMIYIEGHKADYDDWNQPDWNYDSVKPYFTKLRETLSVQKLRSPNPIDQDFIDAANHLQLRECADFNVPEPEGMGHYQLTQQNGKRHSSARAFLTDIQHRENLHIISSAEVSKINFKDCGAESVVINHRGKAKTIAARIEVILCAGAIGSPDLLLRSGVGSAQQIKGFGGEPLHDVPAVGQNLQDHVDMMVICKTRSASPYGVSIRALPRLAFETARWFFSNSGMFASNMVEAGGFARSQSSEPRPDIQFHIIPARKSHRGRMFEYGHGVSLHTCVLRPHSRGSVTRSHMGGSPNIDLGLLNDDRDLETLLRGVKLARNILQQEPMSKHGLTEIVPGSAAQSDDQLREAIRAHARTVYHPVGTCAMGAVVDHTLKVKGLSGLRVVDASVMPRIVSGNTNAPTMMIAEKAADMILADRKLRLAA